MRGKGCAEAFAAAPLEFDEYAASVSSSDDLRPDDTRPSQTASSTKRKSRMGRRHQKLSSDRPTLESTQAFADAVELDDLYGLDFLDFSKPNRKKKGKKTQRTADLALSDSELELELEKAWRTDREKKKLKKQRREELRSQGLLGRGITQPDLKTKYSGGMDADDLGVELRAFFLSSRSR